MNREAPPQVRGFSLVELMVSLVIGLIILLALSVVLMGSINSVATAEGQSALFDNGRRASNFVRQMLQQAGYRPFARTVSGFGFNPDPNWATTYQTAAVTDGGIDGVDVLNVRFWGSSNGLVVDCSGTPVADTTSISVTIDVVANQLRCTDSVSGVPQVVARDIESLQVRYSLLDESDYINNLAVNDNRWERLNRVEFAILARSSELSANGPVNNRSYEVLEQTITAPSDRYLRSVMQESVLVRNLIMSGRP